MDGSLQQQSRVEIQSSVDEHLDACFLLHNYSMAAAVRLLQDAHYAMLYTTRSMANKPQNSQQYSAHKPNANTRTICMEYELAGWH